MSILYCPLCGILLIPDPFLPDDPELSRPRPWFAEVRGITIQPGKTPQDPDAVLTGIGIIRDDNVLLAPADSNRSYLGNYNLKKWVLCERFEGSGGFGFHEACWKLLVLRLGPMYERFKPDFLTAMFSLLWSTPCVNSSSFDFGHDYDGAEVLRDMRVRPWTIKLGWHLYAHPFPTHQLDALDAPLTTDTEGKKRGTETGARLFGVFPPELKDEIFSYLSYDEVETMRLVSSDMAHLAADHRLPQMYWKSKFMLGQEMDFIFPDHKKKRDWRKIFFAAKLYLDQKDGFMVNRRRIRILLEPIAALLEERAAMGLPMPDGLPLVSVYYQNGVRCMRSQGGGAYAYVSVDYEDLFSAHISSTDADRVLELGCRRLNWVMYPLKRLDQVQYNTIVVSTVRLGSRRFVSGICMLEDDSDTAQTPWIGYPEYSQKVRVIVPRTSRLVSISIAFCAQGLRALRFNFTNSESSAWVGDSTDAGVACGKLLVPASQPWAFVVGTDHFKLVSLGIGVLSTRSPTPPEKPRPALRTALSHLWINGIPSHQGLFLGDLRPPVPPPPFEPLVNFDFGGPKGLRLCSLTRFVFYMGGNDDVIRGVEAIYGDGSTVFVGRRIGCELSFPIDGVGGERLNRVGVIDNSRLIDDTQFSEDQLFGIQLTTNYGRTATFAAIKSRSARTVLWSSNKYPKYAITGFAIGYVPHKDRFGRLALQYQKSEPPAINAPASLKVPHGAPRGALDKSLQYDTQFSIFTDYPDSGSYQTHATLAGVRRIQASVGIEGRSRTPNSICGLKFEYDDSSVSIIGQWMQPYDSLKLGSDAKVQSLTVWVNKSQKGQVSAIKIVTSDARAITFIPRGVWSLPGGDLRHEYGTGPGEQVTDIFWVLNDCFDRVRAVVEPKYQRLSTLLPNQYPPFDAVQKLYFQRIAGDGSRDRVVKAKAYFLETALVGLKFIYESGSKAQIGDTKDVPDHCVKVRFVKHARVVGMLVGIRDDHIRYLKFHLDYYRKSSSKMPVKAFSYTLDLISPLEDVNTASYKCQSAWCRDAEAAAKFPRAQVNHNVYAPPSSGGALAGLYVRCHQFSCLGALYE